MDFDVFCDESHPDLLASKSSSAKYLLIGSLHWIKPALQDPASQRFAGWDSIKKHYDQTRRVTIVMGNYVVVIALLSKIANQARFVTAYVADTIGKNGRPSTIDLIRSGPLWEPKEIKKPLICQAGSAEAFIGSTITDGELPSV